MIKNIKPPTENLDNVKKNKELKNITLESQWEIILSRKNSEADLIKIKEVKQALEEGEIEIGISVSKFTKAHVIRLYTLLKEQRRDSIIKKLVDNCPSFYKLVNTVELFESMKLVLEASKHYTIDTETTGLSQVTNEICGISIRASNGNCFYIPIRHTSGIQLPVDYVINGLKPFLEDEKDKYLFNVLFDYFMIYKEGIEIKGKLIDVYVLINVLNENEPDYRLKTLVTKYGKHFGFEEESYTFDYLFGKGGAENIPLDICSYYACKDVDITFEFGQWCYSHINQQERLKEYAEFEIEVLKVIVEMKKKGMKIDLQFAKEYADKLRLEIEELEIKLKTETGIDNLNSPQQLLNYLRLNGYLKDSDSSVSVDVLERIQNKCSSVKDILKYREKSKLLSTYFDALPNLVWSDGYIRGDINNMGTVTGRCSSKEPNLQNIPKEARPMFVADEGYKILGIDFSQQEIRYLAHISNDVALQQPYLKGEDIYSSLASKIFNKPIEECGDGTKERQQTKVIVLSILYGLSEYSLAESLGITTEEATKYRLDFLNQYPDVKQFMENIYKQVFSEGFIWLHNLRKRRFPDAVEIGKKYNTVVNRYKRKGVDLQNIDIWKCKEIYYKEKKEISEIVGKYNSICRRAVNSAVQGGSAIMTKLAMCNLYNLLKEKTGCNLIAQVHDELLIQVPEDIPVETIKEIALTMATSMYLNVPMVCDVQIMKCWGIDSEKGFKISSKKC